jgi:hypothetical protein
MPWAKGQSGNILGRPRKELCLTTLLKIKLRRKDPKTGANYAQAIVDKIIEAACEKQAWAATTVLDRVDGKVPDRLQVSQEPIVLRIESNARIPKILPTGPAHLIEAKKVEED